MPSFEFFLAEKLGMPVGRLQQELSGYEYMQWSVYYARKAQREELARKAGK
jgi:hypothetical protein